MPSNLPGGVPLRRSQRGSSRPTPPAPKLPLGARVGWQAIGVPHQGIVTHLLPYNLAEVRCDTTGRRYRLIIADLTPLPQL
jgi:hypothetical protein